MKLIIMILSVTAGISTFAADFDFQPIPDLPLNDAPPSTAGEASKPSSNWKFTVGGGVSYAPRFEGAASNRVRLVPLVEARYNDGKLFFSPLRGIGYNFSDEKNTQYGVRLNLGRGRKESADPHLNGMGNISITPEAGLFFNQRFAPWYISSAIADGAHGAHLDLGGGIGFPLSSDDHLRLGANLTWGDSKYNQTYFGVTPAQAAASGNVFAAYNASAGVKDYALTTNWIHNYNKKWFSNAGLSYKWLTGSAEKSPLTQRSSMGSFNFLMGYRF